MLTRRICVLPFLAVVAFCAHSRGDLAISFTEDGSVFHALVAPGSEVTLSVYVRQSGDTSTDGADLVSDGLATAGVQLNYDVGANEAVVTGVSLAAEWNALAKKGFDNGIGVAAMYATALDLELGDFVDIKGNPILIGTVTFQAGSQVGVVTEVVSSDLTDDHDVVPYLAEIISGGESAGFAPLDGEVFANPTLATIETVPEPSTLVLSIVGFGLLATVRVVRRRRSRSS